MENQMSEFLVSFWVAMTACIFGPQPDIKTVEPDHQVQVEPKGGPITCIVKSQGRKIVALASADKAAPQVGSFSLEIVKTGANTARTRQSGEFTLAAGETKPLAVVTMNAASDEKIAGHLLVEWGGGQTKCDYK